MDERTQEEATGQECAERDRLLMESRFDCIAILDREGRLLAMNPEGQRRLAIQDFAPYLNRSWVDLWAEADREAAREAMAAAAAGGVGAFEGSWPTNAGEPICWEVVVTPRRDGAGPPERLLAMARDGSPRQRRETELRQRVAALAETEQRREELLAALGHELRNPLGTLSNALHLLKQRSIDPALARPRELMERQVKQLTQLADDLREISRIDRGKVALVRERVDLARLARDTAEEYRALLEEAGLTLSLQLPPAPLWVEGDPARLSHVIGSLLQSAARGADPGGSVTMGVAAVSSDGETGRGGEGGTGKVQVKGEPAPDDVVVGSPPRPLAPSPPPPRLPVAVLTVSVTASGMAPELLPEAFELLAPPAGSEPSGEGGPGLALALVQCLVELHGGRMAVRSAGAGPGTVFSIWLPRGQFAADMVQ